VLSWHRRTAAAAETAWLITMSGMEQLKSMVSIGDDESALEPEVVLWLRRYAYATHGDADKTVVAVLDEMNQLLRRLRAD
jgi:hypothetical protein